MPVSHHARVCVFQGPRCGGWEEKAEKAQSAGHIKEVNFHMGRLSKSLTWINKEDLKKDNEVGIMPFHPVIPLLQTDPVTIGHT